MSDPTPVAAAIIPFPSRRPAQAGEDGQERLRRALAGLDSAIAGQRAAVAAWRTRVQASPAQVLSATACSAITAAWAPSMPGSDGYTPRLCSLNTPPMQPWFRGQSDGQSGFSSVKNFWLAAR